MRNYDIDNIAILGELTKGDDIVINLVFLNVCKSNILYENRTVMTKYQLSPIQKQYNIVSSNKIKEILKNSLSKLKMLSLDNWNNLEKYYYIKLIDGEELRFELDDTLKELFSGSLIDDSAFENKVTEKVINPPYLNFEDYDESTLLKYNSIFLNNRNKKYKDIIEDISKNCKFYYNDKMIFSNKKEAIKHFNEKAGLFMNNLKKIRYYFSFIGFLENGKSNVGLKLTVNDISYKITIEVYDHLIFEVRVIDFDNNDTKVKYLTPDDIRNILNRNFNDYTDIKKITKDDIFDTQVALMNNKQKLINCKVCGREIEENEFGTCTECHNKIMERLDNKKKKENCVDDCDEEYVVEENDDENNDIEDYEKEFNSYCINCGEKLKLGWKFCKYCGTATKLCPKCGNDIKDEWNFCNYCGEKLK